MSGAGDTLPGGGGPAGIRWSSLLTCWTNMEGVCREAINSQRGDNPSDLHRLWKCTEVLRCTGGQRAETSLGPRHSAELLRHLESLPGTAKSEHGSLLPAQVVQTVVLDPGPLEDPAEMGPQEGTVECPYTAGTLGPGRSKRPLLLQCHSSGSLSASGSRDAKTDAPGVEFFQPLVEGAQALCCGSTDSSDGGCSCR